MFLKRLLSYPVPHGKTFAWKAAPEAKPRVINKINLKKERRISAPSPRKTAKESQPQA